MNKPIPHLWFDKEAKQAAELYTSLFPNSKVDHVTTLRNTPSGDSDLVSFTLAGQPFMAISAGPLFKFNPSVSFQVKCRTEDDVDRIWGKLSDGGSILMPLGAYPFSERYGWLRDRYGLSWQPMYVGGEGGQAITPVLMFTDKVAGKAEEAVHFYSSVFKNSDAHILARYGKGEDPDKEESVKYASFALDGMEFGAMDSARTHGFTFNEAISFLVNCESQEELDYYWNSLSAVPHAEQCGWLKDQYGLSWQIAPAALAEMMRNGTREQMDRLVKAFLPMKKFDIEKLKNAYEGR